MSLPTSEEQFFEWLRTWFPYCYDIKFMMRASKSLKGGLQDVADDLGVRDTPVFSLSAADYIIPTGDAYRNVASGWIRFPSHCIYLLQNARTLLQ